MLGLDLGSLNGMMVNVGTNFLLVIILGEFPRLRGVVVTYCLTVFHKIRREVVLPIYIRSLTCFLLNGTAGYDIKLYNTKLLLVSFGPKD